MSAPALTVSRRDLLSLLIAVLVLSSALVLRYPHTVSATSFRLHPSIYIASNADFTSSNGVVGGLGTSSQPYIIEGWEITSSPGIDMSGTTAYFTIRNVYVHNVDSYSGITLTNVANGQIDNSTLSNNGYGGAGNNGGISIIRSTNILADRNNVSSNTNGGISVYYSDLVLISRNNLSNNGQPAAISGIETLSSTRVTITGNHLVSNDIVPIGSSFQLSSLTVTDNTVNGIPVNYYGNCNGTTVSTGLPQELIFADCTNIHVTSTAFSGTSFGMQLLSVSGADLFGDSFSNNFEGMRVDNSTGVVINGGNLSSNSTGIEVTSSSSITIQRTNITSGNDGISLGGSTNVTIFQNQITGVASGILAYSSNTTITKNIVTGARQGISLGDSRYNANVTDNLVMNNRIGIIFNGNSYAVSGTISRNMIQNNGDGIDLVNNGPFVPFNMNITANNIADNNVGMNENAGIQIHTYHNNFISNTVQATDGLRDFWDNGYPSGGNYWSDYKGVDNCSGPRQDICPSPDGIGDTQLPVGQSFDNYPLMKPFGPADTIRPSWPTGSTLSASSVANTAVTLTWPAGTDDTGILSYQLYNGNRLVVSLSGAIHSFTVTGLSSSTDYTFTVEAVDAWGNNSTSGLSAIVRTSGAGPWQQYWPLIAVAGAAVIILTSFALAKRRSRLRECGPHVGDQQSTSLDS